MNKALPWWNTESRKMGKTVFCQKFKPNYLVCFLLDIFDMLCGKRNVPEVDTRPIVKLTPFIVISKTKTTVSA